MQYNGVAGFFLGMLANCSKRKSFCSVVTTQFAQLERDLYSSGLDNVIGAQKAALNLPWGKGRVDRGGDIERDSKNVARVAFDYVRSQRGSLISFCPPSQFSISHPWSLSVCATTP